MMQNQVQCFSPQVGTLPVVDSASPQTWQTLVLLVSALQGCQLYHHTWHLLQDNSTHGYINWTLKKVFLAIQGIFQVAFKLEHGGEVTFEYFGHLAAQVK